MSRFQKQNNLPSIVPKNYLFILLITLFVIPLLWGLGIFRVPVSSIFPDLQRPHFWTFFSSILILEWIAFLLIYRVTSSNMSVYLNINTAFLRKKRYLLIISFIVICILSYFAPLYLYESIPSESVVLGRIGPVSNLERLAFVFLSLTAGICEEVIFRGYGISVLEKVFKNKLLPLVITSGAFMALHGIAFLPWFLLVQYFIVGMIFGYFFQKYRRLEILIIVHFLIDAIVAISVP
ncbi:MAG: type II CAAX endopeptidase family protein [Bacteroidota bacterium]